jgi:hypothetical protein
MEFFFAALLIALGMPGAVALFPLIVPVLKALLGLIGMISLVLVAVVVFAYKALVKQLPGTPEAGS